MTIELPDTADLRAIACIIQGAHTFRQEHDVCRDRLAAWASCDEKCVNCGQRRCDVFHYVNSKKDYETQWGHERINKVLASAT